MTISQMITKAEHMRADGQISDYASALLHQHLALEQFPESPNVGVALAKFYGTARGEQLLQGSVRKGYEEIQKRSALGNDTADELVDDYPADDQNVQGPIQQAPTSKYLKELDDMAREHMRTPEGKGKTFPQAFTHCATKTEEGVKLMAAHNAAMMNRHTAPGAPD